jgi:Uma2 family endonuclease
MAGSITPPQNAGETAPPGGPHSLHELRQPYHITVDRYRQMIEAGVFSAKDPVYLWEGRLVTKLTKNPAHNLATAALNMALVRLLPLGWFVAPEQPVAVGDDSMPEPDLMVVRGEPRDYLQRDRRAADVALIVDVADSSLAEDQGDVLQKYAREGFPVYWIVNIPDGQVEVYTEPTGPIERPTYRSCRVYRPGETVPVVLDGREIGQVPASDILP